MAVFQNDEVPLRDLIEIALLLARVCSDRCRTDLRTSIPVDLDTPLVLIVYVIFRRSQKRSAFEWRKKSNHPPFIPLLVIAFSVSHGNFLQFFFDSCRRAH